MLLILLQNVIDVTDIILFVIEIVRQFFTMYGYHLHTKLKYYVGTYAFRVPRTDWPKWQSPPGTWVGTQFGRFHILGPIFYVKVLNYGLRSSYEQSQTNFMKILIGRYRLGFYKILFIYHLLYLLNTSC